MMMWKKFQFYLNEPQLEYNCCKIGGKTRMPHDKTEIMASKFGNNPRQLHNYTKIYV